MESFDHCAHCLITSHKILLVDPRKNLEPMIISRNEIVICD